MNGSPAKLGSISGTSGHSSALKMKAEANAAEAASSPAKNIILKEIGKRVLPKVTKYVSKASKTIKKLPKPKAPKTPKNKTITLKPDAKGVFGGNAKSSGGLWSKTPGWVKSTGAYLGIDAALSSVFGGDDNDKKTTTPPATTKPKTPKSSSGDAWSKAVNKNKSTGGGVTLSEYVKIRNSNAKGSAKYNAAQNKINEAYGSSKRYGPGTPSSSSTSNSTTKTRKRLGGGTTKVTKSDGQKTKVKYDRKGDVKKTITKGKGRRTVTDSEGNVIRSRKTRNKKWD